MWRILPGRFRSSHSATCQRAPYFSSGYWCRSTGGHNSRPGHTTRSSSCCNSGLDTTTQHTSCLYSSRHSCACFSPRANTGTLYR